MAQELLLLTTLKFPKSYFQMFQWVGSRKKSQETILVSLIQGRLNQWRFPEINDWMEQLKQRGLGPCYLFGKVLKTKTP